MKNTPRALILGASLLEAVTAWWNTALADGYAQVAIAELKNLEGGTVGDASITQTNHCVLVHIKVSDLPPLNERRAFPCQGALRRWHQFQIIPGTSWRGRGEHGLLNPKGPCKGAICAEVGDA